MDYQAFLLRIWRDPAPENNEWRIVLQSVQSNEKIVLHTLEELIPYLRQLMPEENENDNVQGD